MASFRLESFLTAPPTIVVKVVGLKGNSSKQFTTDESDLMLFSWFIGKQSANAGVTSAEQNILRKSDDLM